MLLLRDRGSGMMGGTVLLEREQELGVLSEALERASRGAGALVLLEGHAGVGKSRLLEAAAQKARDSGLRCMRARGRSPGWYARSVPPASRRSSRRAR
jgi:hypothetical protein